MTIDETLDQLIAHHEPGWSRCYGFFPKVLNDLGLKTGVEIGVAFGGHSEAILQRTGVTRLFGVDSYQNRPEYRDPLNVPQATFDRQYERTRERLSVFGDRYQLIRTDSREAATLVPDQLDFVYLDADHSYDGVLNDLMTWYPKVREGGIIGGHDYASSVHPDVQKVVDLFFNRFGWQVHHEGRGVWWVRKQALPISFIIPITNDDAQLNRSLDAIMDNNFGAGDELVLIDARPESNTARRDLRLQCLRQRVARIIDAEQPGNLAAVCDQAVEATSNPLILRLDPQDVLAPGSVSALREHLAAQVVDAAAFENIEYFQGSPTIVAHVEQHATGRTGFAEFIAQQCGAVMHGPYLFTRESWQRAQGHPDTLPALVSWGLALRQVAKGCTLSMMPGSKCLRELRATAGSTVISSAELNQAALRLLLPHLSFIDARDKSYITSERGRTTWFDQLDQRPLRTTDDAPRGTKWNRGDASLLRRVVTRLTRLAS